MSPRAIRESPLSRPWHRARTPTCPARRSRQSPPAKAVSISPSRTKVDPRITRRAPSAKISRAVSIERIPPPTWQGSRCTKSPISARLSPVPMAASRSISCTSGKSRKPLHPLVKIVELQSFLFALHQLDDLAAHQINRRNQHGHLTGIPADRNCSFKSENELNPK